VSVEQLRAIRTLADRLEKLARNHRPRVFDGDIGFVVAARDLHRHPGVVQAWRTHVSGAVKDHQIDTTHSKMADAGPLAEIGRLLRGSGEHGEP
jgi:glutamate racemase